MTPNKTSSGFGLFFEMGCGKSMTAIAIAGALFQAGKIHRLLIVCPGTIIPTWEGEFEQFANFPYVFHGLYGTKKKRLTALSELEAPGAPALRIAACNYEITFRDGYMEALMDYDADMIICDESQKLKHFGSRQCKAMKVLGEKARYKLALTGTPVTHNQEDVFSQYLFLNPSIYGTNFYAYRNRYCVMGGFQGKQIIRGKNTEELSRKMYSIAYRVTKDEALDLPEQTIMVRQVELEGEKAVYNEVARKSFAQLSEETHITAPILLTKLLRLQQITGGFVQTETEREVIVDGRRTTVTDKRIEQVGTSKLDALEEIVEDYVVEEGRKLVVFANFTAEIAAICQMLDRKGLSYCRLEGSVPMEERGAIRDRFQNDPEVMLFVAQIQTAGVGITLHAASASVFYSTGRNLEYWDQALSRIHRKGQRHPCTHIVLQGKGTVDEKVMKGLKEHKDIADTICDGNWQTYFKEV